MFFNFYLLFLSLFQYNVFLIIILLFLLSLFCVIIQSVFKISIIINLIILFNFQKYWIILIKYSIIYVCDKNS